MSSQSGDELFGSAPRTPADRAAGRRLFRRLAARLHPDRACDPVAATTAFAELSACYQRWLSADALVLRGRCRRYRLGALQAVGTLTGVYRAAIDDTEPDTDADRSAVHDSVVVKIPRSVTSNALIDTERRALRLLCAGRPPARVRELFPQLLDTARLDDPGTGERRELNVLADCTGFVTLAEVATAYPRGLDGRDWAWMYRRLLRALTLAAARGLVHGAVFADNVLIHPGDHRVALVGWTLSTTQGGRPGGVIASRRDDYPPEVAAGDPVTDRTDIHLLHRLMLDLLSPDATAQRRFAAGCLDPDPARRPPAFALIGEYDTLLDRLYGPRRFRPFHLPPQ